MDETGHNGDAGATDSGAGATARDRSRLNGWSTSDSPWSTAGSLNESAGSRNEDDDEIPAWRRPSQEIRPFTRHSFAADLPSGDLQPFAAQNPPAEVRPFGSPPSPFSVMNDTEPGDTRFSGAGRSDTGRGPDPLDPSEELPPPRWSDSRTRYADLLNHFLPRGEPRDQEPRNGEPRAGASRPEPPGAPIARDRPGSLQDALDAPPPSSAPPYPYEGDLDDADGPGPSAAQQRAAVPLERPRPIFPAVRPATPGGGRRPGRAPSESARHALEPTQPDGSAAEPSGGSADTVRVRPSYDPDSFPRRLPYQSATPAVSAPPAGYATSSAYPGLSGGSTGDPGDTPIGEQTARALPQRVPAEPDVPTVPEPPSVEPSAETPALARIATHLRRGDVLSSQDRQEGFDVTAILEAVREVDGVRDASLRSTPAGAHSLRLDLSEGADPAEVSRHVARLLQDRMGLDAAMQGADAMTPGPSPMSPPPANTPPVSAYVPSQAGPSGRASVPSTGTRTGSVRAAGDDLRRLPTAPQAGPDPAVEQRPSPPRPERAPAAPVPAQASAPPMTSPPPAARAVPATLPPHSAPPAPTAPSPHHAPSAAAPSPHHAPSAAASSAYSAPSTAAAGPAPSAPPAPSALPPPSGPAGAGAPPAAAPSATGAPPATGAPAVAARTAPASSSPAASQSPAGLMENVADAPPCGPPRPLDVGERPGPRVTIENVQVNTFGPEATVEVRLGVEGRTASGVASGPSVDGYLLRLCAMATAEAVDELLADTRHPEGPARCFVEHAGTVPFGAMQVAVVVMLLSCDGWVDQLAGSAVVTGDVRHAMVRATLAAVNRRLEALLS